MKTTATTPIVERVGIKTGIITGIALIGYFLLMDVLGFAHILELRFVNFLILAIGIVIGIRRLKTHLGNGEFYLRGIGEGVITAGIASFIFAAFMVLYVTFGNPEFMEYVRANAAFGRYINHVLLFISVFIEGFAGGAIITFCAMQYFKRESNNERA